MSNLEKSSKFDVDIQSCPLMITNVLENSTVNVLSVAVYSFASTKVLITANLRLWSKLMCQLIWYLKLFLEQSRQLPYDILYFPRRKLQMLSGCQYMYSKSIAI